MSIAEIEAELPQLTPDELHRLAMKSWTVFVEKQARRQAGTDCSENDPRLLAALDEAIEKAGVAPNRKYSADEVRARLSKWTSK